MSEIEVLEDITNDLKGMRVLCSASVKKYLLQWENNNSYVDLCKAKIYLDQLVKISKALDDCGVTPYFGNKKDMNNLLRSIEEDNQ